MLLKCDAIVSYTFKHHHQGNHRYQTPAPVHCCPLVVQYEYMLYSQVYAAPCIHINVVMTGRVVPEICSQTNTQIHICAHHNTHTHTFNGPLSRTTQVSQYQKGKTNLDFTEARDSEWQWHQLGYMQVCTLLQTDNHASTPPLSFLQTGCPS